MGRSLNVISLAGLAFAIGMLVDNAVVVLENIYRHYQLGERRAVAAVKGTKEVWGAVVASTLTTLAVFLPVLFIEEEAGQLFRDIALAVSCSVGLSLIVSVTVIPTATMRLLHERHSGKKKVQMPGWLRALGKPFDFIGSRFVHHVVAVNRWAQGGVARQLILIVVLVGLALGVTWMLFPKVEYLPAGNRNLVFGSLLPPPGYNLDEMERMGQTIEAGLKPYWDADPADPGYDDLDAPVIENFFFVSFGRFVILGMTASPSPRAGWCRWPSGSSSPCRVRSASRSRRACSSAASPRAAPSTWS
jgi:HAE1 family hydrophobic/amphiphilic exporter-1